MMINLPGFKRSLTRREKFLLVIFIFCLNIYFFNFLLQPQIVQLKNLKSKLQRILAEKEAYVELYKTPSSLNQELIKYKATLQMVPTKLNISQLLIDLEKWASKANVDIASVYPIKHTSENINGININASNIELTVFGNYSSLLKFISELENYSKVFRINEIKFNMVNDFGKVSSSQWKITINIDIFFMPNQK